MALPALDCFETALVLIPSADVQYSVNGLRLANEKAFPRWAAHISVLVPFVHPPYLSDTVQLIRRALRDRPIQPFDITLDKVATFRQRDYDTVYLTPSDASAGKDQVYGLWKVVRDALAYQGRDFIPHLTLGQAYHGDPLSTSLLHKAHQLARLRLTWTVDRLVVLVKDEADGGKMHPVNEMSLLQSPQILSPLVVIPESRRPSAFDGTRWSDVQGPVLTSSALPRRCTVATFNVLHDVEHPSTPRFPTLKSVVLQSTADILCLQEVSDELLPLLLNDTDIQTRFPWSSRSVDLPLESERNICILGPRKLASSWESVALGKKKHKRAVVLTVVLPSGSVPPLRLVIASIHLSAGSTDELQRTKHAEFRTLLAYLQMTHQNDQWMIIGDTNFADSFDPFSTEYSRKSMFDVWTRLHGDEMSGTTFDPSQNVLALATCKSDHDSHRYDRIYLSHDGPLVPTGATVVRPLDNGQASDHWLLQAEFEVVSEPLSESKIEFGIPELLARGTLPVYGTGTDCPTSKEVETFLHSQNAVPTQDQQARKEAALSALCRILGACPAAAVASTPDTIASAGVRLVAAAVGSFALAVDLPSSDLDCLIVGNISSSTFWNVARYKLRAESRRQVVPSPAGILEPRVLLRRHVRHAAVPMMELVYDGLKIDMQYCPAANIVEGWHQLGTLPPDDSVFALPAPTLRTLNAYRDNLWLMSNVTLPAFRSALRYIKVFTQRHGLFGPRFGYVGGVHLTLLLAKVALTPDLPMEAHSSCSMLLTRFFETYATLTWESDIVTLDARATSYRREPREAMVILSIERPVINVATSATIHSAHTITAVFLTACDRLRSGATWTELVNGVHASTPLEDFVQGFSTYLRIDLNIWSGTGTAGRALVGFVESRLTTLLLTLHHSCPSVQARLWPARLADQQQTDSSLRGFYLIGLTGIVHGSVPMHILTSFENTVRHSAYYDSMNAYLSISQVRSNDTSTPVYNDNYVWSDGGIDEEDDAADGQGQDDLPIDPIADDPLMDGVQKSALASSSAIVASQRPGGKLRTSADVYNRLRWDADLDQNDYVIGYEDRFEGVKEMGIGNWKREVEDEAFVPFHRVIYFRRKSDGMLVWDRKTRTDLLFGSGVPK